MRVILHTGVHCTDEDRLLKCLLRNKGEFRSRGIAVPGPGTYRNLLVSAANALGQARPSEEAREVLLDAMLDEDMMNLDRLILSHDHFFSVPKLMLAGGQYYRRAEDRLEAMTRLFEGDRIELFMALRNPATLLPTAFRDSPVTDVDEFLHGVDPMHLRWSELIARIRDRLPDVPITLWCNEDSPLIWAQIVREMAGLPEGQKIIGGFTLLSEIMSREGMTRFRAYLKKHPGISEVQKRKVMIAFLDKFAIDDLIEEELDLPGWTEAHVDMLTELYEEDVYEIGQMDGVRVIAP